MKEDINIQYLVSSRQDIRWGMTVSTVGHQRITPHAPYPSANHPFLYLFSPGKGRILDEYQLIYISEGNGTFSSASRSETEIKGGDMILLLQGEWHNYRPDPEKGWYEHWIGFRGEGIEYLVAQGFFRKEEPVFQIGNNPEVIGLYQQAARIARDQTTGFQQMLAGIVNLLLGYTYSHNRQAAFENMQVTDHINKAKKILSEQYATAVTPENIAEQVSMSYSRFRKLFKQYTGFSPSQYKENLRLHRAKELLAHTTLTSQEIAFRTGFDTPYYFCLLFKKRIGYTPLQYRKIARGENL